MRYKIVALLLLCVCTCFAQQQYSTTKVWGLSALDSKMSTTNLWFSMANQTGTGRGALATCNAISLGYDNVPTCLYNGTTTPSAANTVWYLDPTTKNWAQLTALGSGWMGVASINQNNMYLFKTSSNCTNLGYGVFHWDGTSATQIAGCVTQINAGYDGTLVATNSLAGGIYILPPGATAWTFPANDHTLGWSYASVMDQTTMCGVKNGLIQIYSDGMSGFTQMTPAPPAAVSTYTCNISNDPNDGLTLFAMYKTTNNHGQYITAVSKFNFTTDTWAYVVTPSAPLAIASIGKWQTMMFDSSGHPYHFNVNGVMYTVTTSGTGPNCPGLNGCPPNTHHAQTLCVSLPGGMNGGCGTQSVIPTTNLYNQRYDVTATGCDALFGDMGACVPVESGDVLCSATNSDLGGPDDIPGSVLLDSVYVGQFDNNFVAEYSLAQTGTFLGYTWWKVPTRIGVTSNACRPGTYAACSPPYGQDTIGKLAECWGSDCTAAKAVGYAKTQAIVHDPGNVLAFGIYYQYFDGDPNTCTLITYWDDAKAGVDRCR